MPILKLSPFGTLEYNKNEIKIKIPLNNYTCTYNQITEISFSEPSLIKNGSINFKFVDRFDIICPYKKKRINEANKVYHELLQFKRDQLSIKIEEKDTSEKIVQTASPDDNDYNIKYCPECGTKVEVATAKFCMNCGINFTLLNIEETDKIEGSSDNTSTNQELEELIAREHEQDSKMYTEGYYFSEEAKIKGKQIYEDKKQYLVDHPDAYDVKGASIIGLFWYALDELPDEEKKIYTLTGKGKYLEEQGKYEEAIKIYQEADNLTLKLKAKEIKELTLELGEGDYLHCAKIRQRIRVCKNNILREKTKKLEEENKSLEKSNPVKAIEIYNQLNELKPGLKKYNKRIEICKKRI